MIASAPADRYAPAPAAARMQSLLLSWILLAGIWVPGLLLVELLVLQRLVLTASALWTAALVPACQALALESLAAPLGFGAALARLARSLRAPRTLLVWSLAVASLVAGWSVGSARLPEAAAALLALAAAVLFAAAARPSGSLAAARGAALALALLLLLALSTQVVPGFERLPRLLAFGWPPRAARLLYLLPWLGAFYAALFRVQRASAAPRETTADWLGAAAGVSAVALVARLLPLSLAVTPQAAEPLGPPTLLVLVTACLAAAGTSLGKGGTPR